MLDTLKKQWWLVIPGIAAIIFLVIYILQILSPEAILAHEVKRDDVLVTLTITGEVQADNTVNVTAPMQSRIEQILVDDGDVVEPGQVLVTLDADDVKAGYAEAKAQAARAQAALRFVLQGTRDEELKRLENALKEARHNAASAKAEAGQAQRFAERLAPLHQDGAISDNEYDDAQTRARNAQAAYSAAAFRLAQAEDRLEQGKTGPTEPEVSEARAAYTAARETANRMAAQLDDQELKSTLAGVVLSRAQDPGEIAQPNQPILKIADRSTLEVLGFVEEADLSRVAVGNACYVVLDANPEDALPGKIKRIGSEVNPQNGTVEIRVVLDTDNALIQKIRLLPGMTADVNVITDELADAVVVPAASVYKERGELWAFKLAGGRVEKAPVKARRVSLEYFEILEGLSPGDWIARTASPELLENGRVEPVPFEGE